MLRASLFRKKPAPATRQDREALDFSRYPARQPMPTNGIRYIALLQVCNEVTGREVRDIRELTKGEIREVKRRIKDGIR